MQLYPAILTESLSTLQEELDLIRVHPQLTTVHLDIVDGFFADNLTVTPLDLVEVNFEGLDIIFHLMVNEPVDFVFEIVSIKDRLPVKGVVAQLERMSNQREYIQEVKRYNWEVGFAVDLHTPLESVEEASWDQLNMLQLMSIEAGFQGTAFSPLVLPKIDEAQKHLKSLGHSPELVVDGGIKLDTVEQLNGKGVDGVVIGSGIWKTADPVSTLQDFTQKMAE